MSDSEDDLPLAQRTATIQPVGTNFNLYHHIPIPVGNETPDPKDARTSATIPDEESDDDKPLSQRNNIIKEESSDDDDDVPLSKKHKNISLSKKPSPKVKPTIKGESMDVDVKLKNGLKRKNSPQVNGVIVKRTKANDDKSMIKNKTKKEEEQEEEIHSWWNEEREDDSIKWTTLEHGGVLFPPNYVPHGVKMKYDGEFITLSPAAEEVASFFAAMLETDHAKNETFQKNFFEDWKAVLKENPKDPKHITDFKKCDFRPIWTKFEADKEKKLALTKEDKKRVKEEKAKAEEPFLFATVDGRKEKVGNFRIEPPGLFRGRGEHPKTGKLKVRVQPEQITLNLGVDAKKPKPPPGHEWGKIVHNQAATWLATWKENVNGSPKYVWLAASSSWKGQSDLYKFEKARKLKNYVDKIRADYTKDLKDKVSEVRQRATAMYLIDELALRAGNEKGDDEADTVGCCSLRYEHVTLEEPNILHFDFLGKDSIRYQNSVPVSPQVFKNIKIFKKQVGPGHMIFDRLTTNGLNKHLNSCMEGLSAKVFRTYNASHTFQQQLDKLTRREDIIADKMLSFNRANREVAVLCNHQRAAPKSHGQQMIKIQDKIRAFKYQRMKLRKQLHELEPSSKKKHPKMHEEESDMDDEWTLDHEKNLVANEREKAKTKFEKQNEKLKAEGKPLLPVSDLKEKLNAVDDMESKLSKERKTGKVVPKAGMTPEKLLASIAKIDQRINATKIQATDKEENKEISLGTSKMNYIDPRITFAWCKKNDVPFEKVFSKTLQEKFRWAQENDADWTF